MTNNIDRAAEIIHDHHDNCLDAANALADAGLLAPDLPNFGDQELVGVDDYGRVFIRYSVDDQWLTKRDARDLALALLAAADYTEGVCRADA